MLYDQAITCTIVPALQAVHCCTAGLVDALVDLVRERGVRTAVGTVDADLSDGQSKVRRVGKADLG
jgi:hypothetical protein